MYSRRNYELFLLRLTRFREVGMVQRWHLMYYAKQVTPENAIEAIEFTKIIPLFLILLLGAATGCTLLMVEILHDCRKNYNRSKRLFTIPKIQVTGPKSDHFTLFVENEVFDHSFTLFVDGRSHLRRRKSSLVEYYS